MALPTVTSVFPNLGNTLGQFVVTVGGTGFSNSPVTVNLTMGSNTYGPYNAQVTSDSFLTYNQPPLVLAGVYEVRVTNGTGQSVANPPLDQLTISYPAGDKINYTVPNYQWDPLANYTNYGVWTFTQPILALGGVSPVLPLLASPPTGVHPYVALVPPWYYVVYNPTTNQLDYIL